MQVEKIRVMHSLKLSKNYNSAGVDIELQVVLGKDDDKDEAIEKAATYLRNKVKSQLLMNMDDWGL